MQSRLRSKTVYAEDEINITRIIIMGIVLHDWHEKL